MAVSTPHTLMVTGGCGFIASNFIDFMLREKGAKVVCYDSLVHSNGSNIDASDKCILVIGDLCNRKLLEQTLHTHNVKEIVHFAALTHVAESFTNPQEYVQANVQGTVSLLEAVRSYGCISRFVYVSTDEVYGDCAVDGTPRVEGDKLQPTNPYAASKVSAEMFTDVYRVSYNIPACVVRMCNIYGPRQTKDKLVPKFIQLAMEGKPFTIEGDGQQLRAWLYIADACRAICCVLLKGKVGEIYNIAPSTELSVLSMAEKIKEQVDGAQGTSESKFTTLSTPDRPYNDQRYIMNSSKIRNELGWSEQVTISAGLKSTVSWYLANEAVEEKGLVLIYGAKGWIGEQFCRLLSDKNIRFVVGKCRLGDDSDQAVEEEILKVSPSHVASFIGRTHGPGNNTIDYLEGSPEKLTINMRDNLYGPLLLAEICRKFNIHFTYIGSGCLFTYTEDRPFGSAPFGENDVPNYFGSSYSVVKGYTDRLMHHYGNVLNVRMRLPVSSQHSSRNLITKLANYPRIVSIPNSVTVLPDLLPLLWELMKKRHVGTVNLVNPGFIEHKDILSDYKKLVDPSHEYEMVDLENKTDFTRDLLKKRSNCYLATDVLTQLFPQVSSAKESVSRAISEMASVEKDTQNS